MISPRPRKETIWESSLLCCWICLKWVPCIIIVKSFFCYQFCVPLTLQQCRMTREQPEIGRIYLGRSTKFKSGSPVSKVAFDNRAVVNRHRNINHSCARVCVLVCRLEEANVWRENELFEDVFFKQQSKLTRSYLNSVKFTRQCNQECFLDARWFVSAQTCDLPAHLFLVICTTFNLRKPVHFRNKGSLTSKLRSNSQTLGDIASFLKQCAISYISVTIFWHGVISGNWGTQLPFDCSAANHHLHLFSICFPVLQFCQYLASRFTASGSGALLSMWLSIICNPSLFTQEKGMENIACAPC